MSGAFSFIPCRCWAKFDSKILNSTPHQIEVYDFEIGGQDKNLSAKASPLANKFFISFFSESIWYVGVCKNWRFGRSFFSWLIFELCCTQRKESVKTARCQDKWLKMGGEITFMSFNPFLDTRVFLLRFQGVRFGDSSQISLWNCSKWSFLMLRKFVLGRSTIHSHKNWTNFLGQQWMKWLKHLWENDRNTWRVDKVCALIAQRFQMIQAFRDIIFWRKGSSVCALTKSIVATRQATTDRKAKTLRLNANQLALMQFPNGH